MVSIIQFFFVPLQPIMRETSEFDRVYRLYYEQLYCFALQYVSDTEECHDLVSAAYEDVWRNFARIERTTVKAYLYSTVRSKCIDYLRRQQCHERYIKYVSYVSQRSVDDRQQMEHDETQRAADALMEQLRSPTREILEACYLKEKKYREVAEEMNISVSTVKKHMVRALKMLRELKNTLNS